MKIIEKNGLFIIETENTHYVCGADGTGLFRHIHWGKKCAPDSYIKPVVHGEKTSNVPGIDVSDTEYMTFGAACTRTPALKAEYADRCRETLLVYKSGRITEEKDKITLEVTLEDEPYSLEVTLCYVVRDGFDVIERYAKIRNGAEANVLIEKAASAEFCLPSKRPYVSTGLGGSWVGEFRQTETEVRSGTLVYETHKGTSEHAFSPCFILSQGATEKSGEIYYGALAWSGSYKIEINRDFSGTTRALIGLSDFDFSYILHPGEQFVTPSVFCGYANSFSDMSNGMNAFAIEHILPKRFAKEPLPVLYNSWEATWFDVNSEGQQSLAEKAAAIGCEMFVMDDGWFGERSDDHAGLGDWYVNPVKFPEGLGPLVRKVKSLGMKFGLWFEPEMVNPDSDLYRAHPDWAYHYDTRESSLLRDQLVLNLTLPEVREHVFDSMDRLVGEYGIDYIKWDANRPFSETGAENLENPRECRLRHIRAVYEIADRLKEKYPDLQIEACASGGGRAELGALSHFDMIWTSDDTDPIDRLEIQHGYSLLYPIKCMRAWVTDTNRDVRPNDWDFRFNVSMQGSLSVGGNLLKFTDEETEIHKKYIALYKSIRNTVQFGRFYRLADFRRDTLYATEYVDGDKAVLFMCTDPCSFFRDKFYHVNFDGLDKDGKYTVTYGADKATYGGDFLMNVGLDFEMYGTLASKIIVFEKEK